MVYDFIANISVFIKQRLFLPRGNNCEIFHFIQLPNLHFSPVCRDMKIKKKIVWSESKQSKQTSVKKCVNIPTKQGKKLKQKMLHKQIFYRFVDVS